MDRIARLADVHYPVLVMPPGIAWVGRVREALGLPGPMSVEGYELMGKDWRFSSEKTERELGYAARPIAETLKATVDSYLELIEAGAFEGPRAPALSSIAKIPLPAKITVQVLLPIDLRAHFGAEPDPEHVYGEVTADMQGLDELSAERQLPLVG